MQTTMPIVKPAGFTQVPLALKICTSGALVSVPCSFEPSPFHRPGLSRTDDLRCTKPLLAGHAREVRPECPFRNRVIRVPKAPPGHRLTSTDRVSDPPYPPDPGLLDPPAASGSRNCRSVGH